ncbi:hypothetical protein EV368DRAFT_69839 [Lentinula lateritia]|nr:hypothetical protein EV368DRAFT_69839 [Lentinula lateritia]
MVYLDTFVVWFVGPPARPVLELILFAVHRKQSAAPAKPVIAQIILFRTYKKELQHDPYLTVLWSFPTSITRSEPRGASQPSSNSTPQTLSKPITLYYFTCGPTVTLFAQGESLKDVYRSVWGNRKLLMFPDQGIGSFAPRKCKDNNFAVVEFELDPSKGVSVNDERSLRSSSSRLFSLGRVRPDVILSTTMKSNAMATLVTDKDGAWAEMKNAKRGKGRMIID